MTSLKFRPHGILQRYAFAILIALEMLLSFSFFGYFHVEPISITIAYIPVLLAGAVAGPLASVTVGMVFGLASMWKASAHYVMPTDQLFSPLLSGSPLGSVVMSVGSRMLFGLIVGLLYFAVRRLRFPWVWTGLVSYLGRTIHSLCVYSAMAVFFPETGASPLNTFSGLLDIQNILVDLLTAAIVLLVCLAAGSKGWQQFQLRLERFRSLQEGSRWQSPVLVVAITAILLSAVAVMSYYVNRIDQVLEFNGVLLTDTSYADMLRLQIQFLLGIISLSILAGLFLMLYRQYTGYIASEGNMDHLTGLLTRKAFFDACQRTLRAAGRSDSPEGYFLMVDVDRFKEVNDAYGHPEGDRALKEVAGQLKDIFGRQGIIGRMGGDEFALLVHGGTARAELEVDIRHFLEQVRKIAWDGRSLTCSVGVVPSRKNLTPEELYLAADRVLYAAKSRGRDCYEIGEPQDAPDAQGSADTSP